MTPKILEYTKTTFKVKTVKNQEICSIFFNKNFQKLYFDLHAKIS